MYKYLYIFFVIFLFSAQLAKSQEKADSTVVIRAFRLDPLTMTANEVDMDTSFNSIYYYIPNYSHNFSNTFLGNSGLASISNDFLKRNYNSDFLFSIPYEVYFNTPYNIPHFNTRKPYTEIKYLSSGTKDDSEQVLTALHTQNVNQYANVGLLYDLIASRGMYPDQNVSVNRMNLFGSYEKDEYSFYTSLNYNGYKGQENGGIQDIEEFKSQQNDALNFVMQLNDANSRFKNMDLFFTQKMNLSIIGKDSLTKEYLDNFTFQHTINYNRYSKTYRDEINSTDSLGYYSNNYYLINQAYDSAFHQNLSNRFDISLNLADETQELRAYVKHEFKTFSYAPPVNASFINGATQIDTVILGNQKNNYNDISVGGQYTGRLKTWYYTINGQLYLTGYNIGDLISNGEFTKYFSKKQRYVKLSGEISSTKPSYFLLNYGSSHFKWDNSFNKIEYSNANFEYSGLKSFKSRVSLSFINDFVYFNSEAIPVQSNEQLLVASISVDKTFKLGYFRSRNQLLIQQTTSDIVRLPNVALNNRTWFEASVFKDALSFQIGAELYFFTKYKADAYMAATGQFYNQDEGTAGNYPFLTGFVNAKIARTRFTLQYTNALAGLIEPNYFMAYRYPNFNETLKFGLAWTFYD